MQTLMQTLMTWIAGRMSKEKKTTDIQKFTATYSPAVRNVLFHISFIPVVLGLIMAALSVFDSEALKISIIPFTLAGLIWIFVLVLALWKLDVDGDELRYRNFLGLTKKTNSYQIDKIVVTDQKTLIIYAKGRKFGTLNRDFMHMDSFYNYCKRKGLPIQAESGRTISKLLLYLSAVKVMFWLGVGIGGFLIVIIIVMAQFDEGAARALSEDVLTIILIAMVPMLPLVGTASAITLRGMSHIVKQEKFFGIRFRDEMQKHHITEIKHMSSDWFINVDNCLIIAFRSGFIIGIDEVREPKSNSRNRYAPFTPRILVIEAMGADGKKKKIVGTEQSIRKLKKWVKRYNVSGDVHRT